MKKIGKRSIKEVVKTYNTMLENNHNENNYQFCVLFDNYKNEIGVFDYDKANQLVENYDFARYEIVTDKNYKLTENELFDMIEYTKQYLIKEARENARENIQEIIEEEEEDENYKEYLYKLYGIERNCHIMYNNKSYAITQKNITVFKYIVLIGVIAKGTNSINTVKNMTRQNKNAIVLTVNDAKKDYIITNLGNLYYCYHSNNTVVCYDKEANKQYKKAVLLNNLLTKYQYENDNNNNKIILAKIICNMIKMNKLTKNFYNYHLTYSMQNLVINKAKEYKEANKQYKKAKINYHYQQWKKHEIKQTIQESCLLNIDDNYVYTENEKKKILDNALTVLNNSFCRYDSFQYAISSQETNNTIMNYARIALLNKKVLVTAIKNKDIIINSCKLRNLQIELETSLHNCKNQKRKEILSFYCWSLYSLWYIVDDIESSEQLEAIEKLLFKYKEVA